MDEQRTRIEEDLRGLVAGEVRADDVLLQLYASDASLYQIKPLAVVRPRTAADVSACLRYAHENLIPVHARGAGTGLAGESLGPGLVLDFSSHFRRILEFGPDWVRVQPGVVLERLNTYLRPQGRVFGPDPAMSHVTTMGSVVAIDAAGSRWLKFGSARGSVRRLRIVLADGTEMEVGREPVSGSANSDDQRVKGELVARLADVLSRNAKLIRESQPKSLVNRCGYELADVLADGQLDLPRLLVGSEGTLALITEMTVATQPTPKHVGTALLFFDRLESAARAVEEILSFSPIACDLMDRRHLTLARESDPRYDLMIPAAAEALLLVELEGRDPVELRERIRQLIDRVRRRKRLAFDARQAVGQDDMDLSWRLAQKVVPTLYRLKGSTRAVPFVEDIAIPPAALPGFVVEMQNILKRHQVTASLFGHAGHGQLHIRPFLDLSDPEHVRTMSALAADLYDAVFRVEGTISGEHGDGLSRTQFVRRQYGALYDVFREVKGIFDPNNILNPGKVIGDDPELMTRDLRPAIVPGMFGEPSTNGAPAAQEPAGEPREFVPLELTWSAAELAEVTTSCNGCGACRAQDPTVRMCPMFRFAPAEEASPRAKANLIRGVLTGALPPRTLSSDEFKTVADLCVNCKMCRLECPAGVDIPKLMIEGKANYVATNGLRLDDWVLTRLDLMGRLAGLLSPFANWAIANRQARWIVDKTLGIAQRRKLPRFASRSFLRRSARRRLTSPTRRAGRKVLYFVDTYANFNDPQLGEAFVAVLEHNGVAVYVHPDQRASGMALVSRGAIDAARQVATDNVRILAEAVRQGYAIVATEPSAALCLSQEYPALLDDDETRLVAANTFEACHYLWQMHLTGKLQLDLKPINATLGYHQPCHQRALAIGTPGENLLRLIPGLSVQHVERGCSGMAGTFGLARQNYRNSLRAGWGLISAMRDGTFQAGTTECSACKLQMEQGTTKPTIHPLKLLALAYRLMPELSALLTARSEELVVT
ncbi:MAG: anaerobic glycerol-3-phosphate dehydrogenase subunit C [Planctomycetia bacterium]|nr:anaerobic glycerol-3-phosphate dehydrogenase subunit C [Planctomycetia bacterium]